MDYVQTTQDIIDWYMHNPSAQSSLITAFRAAMTTPIQSQQQQSPAPAEQNNNQSLQLNNASPSNSNKTMAQNSDTDSNYDGDDVSNTKNTTMTGDSTNSYSEPLGVSENSTGVEPLPATELAVAVAAAVVTSGALVSAAFVKPDDDDGENQGE